MSRVFSPAPQGLRALGQDVARWLQQVANRRRAPIANLGLTISNPPTQAEVQAIANKIDAILAADRTAGLQEE